MRRDHPLPASPKQPTASARRSQFIQANQDVTAVLATEKRIKGRGLHSQVRSTLVEVSAEVRASYFAAGDDHLDAALKAGADLMGKNLRSRRLCGADLRGAYLIAADLRGSDLSGAVLLGADFRDARVHGADLSRAIYLTQPQLNAASGNRATLLPAELERPSHWNIE